MFWSNIVDIVTRLKLFHEIVSICSYISALNIHIVKYVIYVKLKLTHSYLFLISIWQITD